MIESTQSLGMDKFRVAFTRFLAFYSDNPSVIGVRAGGAGGAAAPPVSKIFGQNAKNSGNKETINDGIEK